MKGNSSAYFIGLLGSLDEFILVKHRIQVKWLFSLIIFIEGVVSALGEGNEVGEINIGDFTTICYIFLKIINYFNWDTIYI